MEFKLKHAATDYDIPLALISMPEVRARDIVQSYDFSHEMTGNPIAAFMWMDTFPDGGNSTESEKYRLIADNLYGKVLLTDEYYYERAYGTKVPLWYAHPLKRTYFNPNVIDRLLKQPVREDQVQLDRTIKGLIPTKGSYVIASDSITVSVKELSTSSFVELTKDEYHVDYALGTITVAESAMYALSGDPIYEYQVEYTLVPIDIRVQGAREALYRFEAIQVAEDAPHYFTVSILSTSDEQLYVTYRSQSDLSVVEEVQEYTTSVPLFTEVPDTVRTTIIGDSTVEYSARRVFSLVRNNNIDQIYVTEKNSEHSFSIKSARIQSTKIKLKEPLIGSFYDDWHLRLSTGYVHTAGTEYEITSQASKEFVREHARIVTKRLISVSGKNLVASLNSDGTWSGITVTRRIDGTTIKVTSVDAKHGVIGLAQDVSRRDYLVVEYSIRSDDMVLRDLCYNPMSNHSHHFADATTKALVICMIPSHVVPHGKTNPIYYLKLNRYLTGRPVTYTYDLINNWINANLKETRNEYRSTMGLPDIMLEDPLIRIEPLAIVHIANPFDTDAYSIDDMRVYGGGYSEYQPSFHDYAYYDGEGTDLESMLVFEVPQWIKTDLTTRAKLWDAEVIKSDAPDQLADYKAQQEIETKASSH